MKNGNKFSRRNFLRNSVLGIGIFAIDKNINSINFNNNIKKKGENKKM